MGRAQVTSWSAATMAFAAAVAAVVVNTRSAANMGWGELATLIAIALGIVAVGLFLVVRAGAAVVGSLLLALGTFLAFDTLIDAAAEEWLSDPGATSWFQRLLVSVSSSDWIVVFGLLAALALVFPDGRPLGGRWRIAFGTSVGVFALTFVANLLPERPNEGAFAPIPGAFGISDWLSGALMVLLLPLCLVALVGAAAAVVVRYQGSVGIERRQLMWLAWSVGVVPLTLVICVLTALVAPRLQEAAVTLLFVLTLVLPTLSVAVAVTRYRLYAIDRIVNRTLVYAILTVALGAIWLGFVVVGGVLVGQGSEWATALGTLLVALAFNPARRRVQNAVDRRFDRARLDGVGRVRAFEEAVRAGTREPEDVGSVLREALRDPTAELLFSLQASDHYVDVHGELSADTTDRRARTPVVRSGHEVGLVLHDPALLERPGLLESVLSAAALTVEIARLRIEVRVQLAEVERSRARIVRAGYEERRRLERDLHDGAQQRLVSLGIVLRRLERSLPNEAQVLRPALDGAVDEIGRAIADLRTIAAGLRPARLDEGLGAALADLARTAPIPVDVEVSTARLPAPVEETAYFVACEALTNAVKHASPSHVEMRAARANGTLRLSISDDGVGGARVGVGSGLVGLVDRVHAHGGELRINSPEGAGTRVEVELPCA